MPAFVPPPPPVVTIGHADAVAITRAALDLQGRHATLTLVLSTSVRQRRDIALPISVPHGAAITGLVVVEQDHRTLAMVEEPQHAYDLYNSTVSREIDPVMLAYHSSTREQDTLQLQVFPLAKAAPVTIEIAMELPDGNALVIDPDGGTLARLEVTGGGRPHVFAKLRAQTQIELPDGHAQPAMSLVDENTALYAQPVLEPPAHDRSGPAGLRTAADVRTGMRSVMSALAACAEQDPTPHAMSFVIAPDGTVSDVAGVDGCFADAIESAHFAPAREATAIRYPLSWDIAH